MGTTPRLVLVTTALLVLPALVTALFLARNARPAVEAGAQPGGVVQGRLVPIASTGVASLVGVDVLVFGRGPDGVPFSIAHGSTDEIGRFAVPVPPLDGVYEVRVSAGEWQEVVLPVTLLPDGPSSSRAPLEVPVREAAQIEFVFQRRSGLPVRGGTWTVNGETSRSWFSAAGASHASSGAFEGATLRVAGLPPMRATLRVLFDGGDRSELVVDLAPGPNRHTVEL